jgi:restriction system protein
LDAAFLRANYQEFREFASPQQSQDLPEQPLEAERQRQIQQETATPEESLEAAYQNLRHAVESDLLARLTECSPAFFERVVVQLLIAMGYGGTLRDAGAAIGRSGDEGIDGIIKENRQGLDVVYVQAKMGQYRRPS